MTAALTDAVQRRPTADWVRTQDWRSAGLTADVQGPACVCSGVGEGGGEGGCRGKGGGLAAWWSPAHVRLAYMTAFVRHVSSFSDLCTCDVQKCHWSLRSATARQSAALLKNNESGNPSEWYSRSRLHLLFFPVRVHGKFKLPLFRCARPSDSYHVTGMMRPRPLWKPSRFPITVIFKKSLTQILKSSL